jgi:hypothetical protein
MDKLDKFIIENRELFDDAEPLEGHFSRFEEKLDRQLHAGSTFTFSRNYFLKIAAGLLVLMTVSVYIFDFAAHRVSKSLNSQNKSWGSSEMQDAINYYDDAASMKLGQINKLACCGQDAGKIYSMAKSEMNSLNANAAELQKTLSENPGNERIQAAIIQNHQMKEKVMNEMVEEMKKR